MTTFTPKFADALDTMQNLEDATSVLGYAEAESVWNALTGRDDPQGNEYSLSAMMTLPEEYAPLMRRAGGIPAATFISFLGKRVTHDRGALGWKLRAIFNQAWEDFRLRADIGDMIVNGTGWDLSEAWQTVVELEDPSAEPWAKNLVTDIVRLAGRMYEVLRGHTRRVPDGNPQEVKSVTVGGDLARLMPQEHALLGSAVTADLKAMDVLQAKAIQVEVAGDKPAGSGPLVICVDESDSMWDYRRNHSHGTGAASDRNVWAKACMMAMIRLAHDENRMVHVVHFSEGCLTRHCKPGDRRAQLDALTHFMHGGTAIHKALSAGDKQVKTMAKAGHIGADVIMVTDGRAGSVAKQEQTILNMYAKGVRTWTIGIAVEFDKEEPLRKYAEHYVHVDQAAINKQDTSAVKGFRKAASGEK